MLKHNYTHILVLILLMMSGTSNAQFGFQYDNTIAVLQGGDTLKNAWGGGLNYTQVSDFDYDFDGDMDLMLFDRSSNNLRVFTREQQGGTEFYQLAYNAKADFPADIRYRATMVDYDGDGRKDLWTYGIGGLKVYRNVGDIGNGLQWELASELLQSEYVNGTSQLYVSSSDIPAIVDVDFDGDIDVLTFHQGGENVEYHQNQSMELYGIPDSLIYELKNECWGLFREDFSTNVISLNDNQVPCVGGSIPNPLRTTGVTESINQKKHSGSTLLAIDVDNSGVLDLILGDVSFPTMTMLLNGGSAPNTNSAMISQDNSYPSNTTPIDLQLFPAAFYVDVDFDGIKDLIVGANARNISENETSILFYKNLGSDNQPNFIFMTDDLFQNEMIEHGTGTIPVFFDVDEDGLEDMIVANFFRYIPTLDKESTMAYYKNTGTASNPVFTYVDYNYLNLDQENFGLRSVPTFGDIDNDGDKDMFLGIENGTIVYYQNNSSGSGAVWATPQINYQDNNGTAISSSGYAHPQLFDLDNDGLLDLVIGAKTGEILYYRNIGTAAAPSFELTNDMVGNVNVSAAMPNSYAAPHFFRLNNETHLFAGSSDGVLIYYDSIDNRLDPGQSFHQVSDNYLGIDVEAYSSFAVNDINGDGNLNLFVGQDLGGLYHFEADPNSSISIEEKDISTSVALYPNPSDDNITIASSQVEIEDITIIDMRGRTVYSGQPNAFKSEINVSQFNVGIYLVKISTGKGVVSRKFVKQ